MFPCKFSDSTLRDVQIRWASISLQKATTLACTSFLFKIVVSPSLIV